MSRFNFYLLHPKYFFIWFLVLLMYVLAKFPLKAKRFIGAIIGNLSFLFLKKPKKQSLLISAYAFQKFQKKIKKRLL